MFWRAVTAESDLWELTISHADTRVDVLLRLIYEAKEAPMFYELPNMPTKQLLSEPASFVSKDSVDLHSILGFLVPNLKDNDRYPSPLGLLRTAYSEVIR